MNMKRRLFVPLIVAGVAAASGVASANPQYWRANGLMLEVSADPRDGHDFVQVDATRADQLQLVALDDTVTLRRMTLHFADGRSISRPMRFVQPGQPLLVELPENCEPITSVELDYGDPALRRYDRSPARLQIIPRTNAVRRTAYMSPYRSARCTVVRPRQHGWSIAARLRF
jgi:hypothetical protein